jgi:short-subunit dehydrogenase
LIFRPVAALATLPNVPAYSISKAAAFSRSQSLRAVLAGRGVKVHAVLGGPVDTDMSRGFDVPKASPASVARAIFDEMEKGEEDIFPDSMSQTMAESLAQRCGQVRMNWSNLCTRP